MELWNNSANYYGNTTVSSFYILGNCKSMEVMLLWCALETASFFLGCPSCVVIMWHLLRRYQSGSTSFNNDIILFNLCILYIIYNFSLFMDVLNAVVFNSTLPAGLIKFPYSVSLTGGPLSMTCICINWYLAVLWPVFYRYTKGVLYQVCLTVVIWIYTLVPGILTILKNLSFTNPLCLTAFGINLTAVVFCNISILVALKRSGPGGGSLHPVKRRAFKAALSVLVVMVMHSLPLVTVLAFDDLLSAYAQLYRCVLLSAVMSFPGATSSVIPLLYLYSQGKLSCHQRRLCSGPHGV